MHPLLVEHLVEQEHIKLKFPSINLNVPSSKSINHPPAFGCSQLTVSCVPRSWWCVLKDDWHEGLTNGALPRLGHLTPNATVGSYLAWGGRGLGESLGVARG